MLCVASISACLWWAGKLSRVTWWLIRTLTHGHRCDFGILVTWHHRLSLWALTIKTAHRVQKTGVIFNVSLIIRAVLRLFITLFTASKVAWCTFTCCHEGLRWWLVVASLSVLVVLSDRLLVFLISVDRVMWWQELLWIVSDPDSWPLSLIRRDCNLLFGAFRPSAIYTVIDTALATIVWLHMNIRCCFILHRVKSSLEGSF